MSDRDVLLFDPAWLRRTVGRFSYVGLTIVDIAFASTIWSASGYLHLPSLVSVWILLLVAGISLVVASMLGEQKRGMDYLFLGLLIASIAAFFAALLQSYPALGTDELAIDTYSAYLLLHGMNPYFNTNMLSVFQFYSFPLYFITPVLTGGYVHYLTYPGLSVLLFVPAVLLGIGTNLVLILFNLLAFVLLFVYYRKMQFTELFPYAAFILLININMVYYSVGGVTDIVWMVFLGASYAFRSRAYTSGALFGLAIAFKQTPAILFPFFLYFIFRESGGSVKRSAGFTAAAAAAFLLPNIPFILMSPSDWLHNVAGVATQPIIGIGMGPSILAFTGALQIASFVFYVVPALILSACFVVYVSNYERMKYTFFAFPGIAFIFYYRLLLNYVMYWPFMVLMLMPDLLLEIGSRTSAPGIRQNLKWPRAFFSGIRGRKVETLLLALILIAGIAVTSYGFVVGSRQPLKVLGVGGFNDTASTGVSITSMNVMLEYDPLNGGPAHIPVSFRILTDSPIVSANGLLWSATRPLLSPGVNNLTIIPDTAVDALPAGLPFRLIAYYGSYQTAYNSPGASAPPAVLFVNPYLLMPAANDSTSIPPGWFFTPNTAGGSAHYALKNGSLTLNATKTSRKTDWAVSQFTNGGINMSGLLKGNYTLSYDVSIVSGSTAGGSNVTAGGMPDTFYGTQIQFADDTEQIWIGYNGSVPLALYRPNAYTLVIISNTTVINFSSIYGIAAAMGWPTGSANFAYVVGSWTQPGVFGARFNSFLLQGKRT